MDKDKDLVIKARKRFHVMRDHDDDNRREGLNDYKFANVPGNQWTEASKSSRGNRPCLEFNKTRISCNRIINEQRNSRPNGKVRGVEGGDPKVAEIYEGLIRNIWNTSKGDTVVDTAADYQVGAGMGAWRIVSSYSTKTGFEQEIALEPIQNPFNLFWDNQATDLLKKDANDWILTRKMSEEAFKEQYPDASPVEFEDHEFDDDTDWEDEDGGVRVAEYWYKQPVQKELWLLQDGKTVEADTDEAAVIAQTPEMIKRKRMVSTHKIMMCVVSGNAVLEQPVEWPGSEFPFIVCFGHYFIADGKTHWYGAVRWAKDPQRSYNTSRTAVTETIAQAPLATIWATPEQAEGHTDKWVIAHKEAMPWRLYNPDMKAPGPPVRTGGADVPSALITETQIASEELNMVMGIYQNDVGAPNQASSGRQEIVRNQQGAVATFNFPDNMAKAVERTWELLIDLIPQVYDTERELRILGQDGAEDYVKINSFVQDPETGEKIKVNDVSVGRYDVTVTTGPNFTTQRQEAAEMYGEMARNNPEFWMIAGDLIMKATDLPYSEEIGERLQTMLPPPIQNMLNEEKDIPPEVQAMMQQAQQAMQVVEQQAQAVQQQAQEADLAKSEVEKLMADLATKQAQFEAKVAKELARIAEKDSKYTVAKLQGDSDGILEASRQTAAQASAEFHQALAIDVTQMLASIQDMAAQLGEQAVGAINEVKTEREVKPRIKRIVQVRENGQLTAVPEYEDAVNG